MATGVVRIGDRARSVLREIAARTGQSAPEILDQALEQYRRTCFLEETNRAFAALKKDKRAWRKGLEERRAWDATLADGREGRRK